MAISSQNQLLLFLLLIMHQKIQKSHYRISLLLQLLQDQCHNARPLHHYQLINSQKHAEQGHQLHSKKLFDLEFPSIACQVDSGSILEPDLSASRSTDNVDDNETIGSGQSRTRSSINITELRKGLKDSVF